MTNIFTDANLTNSRQTKIGLGIEIGAVFKGLGAFKDTAKSVDELNPKLSTLGKIKLGITDSFKALSSQVKLTTKDIEKFNSIKEKMESTNLKLDSLKNYRNDLNLLSWIKLLLVQL